MQVETFTFNPFQENTYVLYDNTKQCIIIDPGCYRTSEEQELFSFIDKNQLQPVAIVNTHCHIDHVFGVNWVKEKYGIPFYCHHGEIEGLKQVHQYAQMYGISMAEVSLPDQLISEKDEVLFGNTRLFARFTPGHSPASLCFIHKESKQMIAGDVLFKQSIGRTDLPGGDYKTLMKSIVNELLPLPDDYIVYSGHGPQTTIGDERNSNPFVLEYLREH